MLLLGVVLALVHTVVGIRRRLGSMGSCKGYTLLFVVFFMFCCCISCFCCGVVIGSLIRCLISSMVKYSLNRCIVCWFGIAIMFAFIPFSFGFCDSIIVINCSMYVLNGSIVCCMSMFSLDQMYLSCAASEFVCFWMPISSGAIPCAVSIVSVAVSLVCILFSGVFVGAGIGSIFICPSNLSPSTVVSGSGCIIMLPLCTMFFLMSFVYCCSWSWYVWSSGSLANVSEYMLTMYCESNPFCADCRPNRSK